MKHSGSNIFYISTSDGKVEEGDGSFEKPFKSFKKAKEIIRGIIADGMKEDIYVYLRGGHYFIEETIAFDEGDSGRDGYKIIYRNYENEIPVLHGGKRITEWEVHEGNIYKSYIGTGWSFNTMFENDHRSVMARFPNLVKDAAPAGEYLTGAWTVEYDRDRNMGFEDKQIPVIKDTENLEIYLWPAEDDGRNWHQNTLKVTGIDNDKRIISWNVPSTYGAGKGSRYFLQGALELLDERGEFYLDRKQGILYYWPFNSDIKEQIIVAPKVQSVISFKGTDAENRVHDIVFEGITIRDSDLPDFHIYGTFAQGIVYLENASNIKIQNCSIFNSGWHGVHLFGAVEDNEIKGNYIYNIGHTGVQLEDLPRGGKGPYKNKGTRIINNLIANVGQLVGYASCMELIDSGDNYIAHNKLQGAPRYCIGMSSMTPGVLIGEKAWDGEIITAENVKRYQHTRNNIIEYNDMSDANRDSQDTGVLQTWCPGEGNVFNNNSIHDSDIYFSFGTGIYLDDIADGFKVTNNLIYNLQKRGQGNLGCAITAKGIGNYIANNIIAENNVTKGGGGIGTTDMLLKRENHHLLLEKNVFYNTGDSAYVFSNWDEDRYEYCDHNVFYNSNQSCGVRGALGIPDFLTLEEWREASEERFDMYSKETDPSFMLPEENDYRLRYDSECLDLGIEDIIVESIGLKEDFQHLFNEDYLERIFIKSLVSGGRSYINLDTVSNRNIQLEISGRTQKGCYLPSLKGYKLTFTSADEKIAKIDDKGLITALSGGVTEIHVYAEKQNIKRHSFMHVIVDDSLEKLRVNIPVRVLPVNQVSKLECIGISRYGQYMKLQDRVTFKSSNEQIISATSDGTITALAPGKARITASVSIGDTEVIEVLEFTVEKKTLRSISTSAKSILKTGEEAVIRVKGKSNRRKEMEIPALNITYHSCDSDIIAVDENGVLKALAKGETIVTVKVKMDGIEKSKKLKIRVFEDEGLTSGWKVSNYGEAQGLASFSEGKFIMLSNGENVWFRKDDFTFLFNSVKLEPGKVVTLSAKFHSLLDTSPNAQVGLMLRAEDSQASPHINIRVNSSGTAMVAYREVKQGETKFMAVPRLSLPLEFKLILKDNSVTAYCREDKVSIGQNKVWLEIGSISIDFKEEALAGMALFSNNKSTSTEAIATDVNII